MQLRCHAELVLGRFSLKGHILCWGSRIAFGMLFFGAMHVEALDVYQPNCNASGFVFALCGSCLPGRRANRVRATVHLQMYCKHDAVVLLHPCCCSTVKNGENVRLS